MLKNLFSTILYFIVSLTCTISCVHVPFVDPAELSPRNTLSSVISTSTVAYGENQKLVTIETVDSRPARFLDNQIVIAPGFHTIGIKVEMAHDSKKKKERVFTTKASSELSFVVLSDVDYLIDAHENAEGLWIWIEDTVDKKVVAGSKPKLVK